MVFKRGNFPRKFVSFDVLTRPGMITNIISAVYMFIILVTSSPISSSIFISFVFYQKVTHYWQLWLLLTIICHYNTRACVYLETLFVTLYDNG